MPSLGRAIRVRRRHCPPASPAADGALPSSQMELSLVDGRGHPTVRSALLKPNNGVCSSAEYSHRFGTNRDSACTVSERPVSEFFGVIRPAPIKPVRS
jgi:hypothetical protein